MKKLLLLLAVLSLAHGSQLYAQNLHTHSNAATPGTDFNSISGWGPNSGALLSSTTETVQNGTYALRLEHAAGNSSARSMDYHFNANIGEEYLIKIWAKQGAQSNDPAFASWTGISGFSTTAISATDWVEYTWTVTATAAVPKIRIYTGSSSGGSVGDVLYIDNVSIISTTSPSITTNYGINSGTNGEYNAFFGTYTGSATTGDYNTFVGAQSGKENIDGTGNVFVGSSAGGNNLSGSKNIFIGHYAGLLNTDGTLNVFNGYYAGRYNTGNYNTFAGGQSGEHNTSGFNNSFYGYKSGYGNSEGQSNTLLGASSGAQNETGSNNTFLGAASGYSMVSGSGNVFLGHKAGYNETGSNKLYIDNSDTATPLLYGDFTTNQLGVNTNVIPVGYAFAVKGKLIAEKIKVQVYPWADYVFEADYKLPTLEEVERHIQEKGHLANIPSAAEVHKEGIYVGEMHAKLLRKIEELTLYTIAQEKKLKQQEQENKALKARLDALEVLIKANKQ